MSTSAAGGTHLAYRADVEGLRGLAIVLVVLYHARLLGMHGGFVGVDVFFVLSGYLITGLLVKEAEQRGRLDFARFYARRMRRLLPAVAVVLLATLALARVVYSPLEQATVTQSARDAALYMSNLRFALQTLDYHAADAALNPLLHTWSLAVEEQFYVFWPLLVAAALGVVRVAGGRAGNRAMHRSRLVRVVVAASLASFALCVWQTGAVRPWAFFGLPARVWEFGLGGLAAVSGRKLPPRRAAAVGAVGLVVVVASGVVFTAATPFPGYAALLPVLGTIALLLAGEVESTSPVQRVLRSGPMLWFGRLSYSWYLWHWPILVLAGAAWGDLGAAARLGCLAASLALSAATHAVVEDPVRHSRWLAPRPALSIALGLTFTLATAGGAVVARKFGERSANHGLQRTYADAREDRPRMLDARGCMLTFTEIEARRPCVFGDTTSPRTVVLFGDSHAGQWFPAMERLATARHWRLVTMLKSACPVADVETYTARLGRVIHECGPWRRASVQRIAALRPVLVIIAHASGLNVRDDPPAGDDASAPDAPRFHTVASWAAGLRPVLVHLDSLAIPTVIIRDTPLPGFDVPVCLARAAWAPWQARDCTYARSSGVLAETEDADRRAAAGLPHVTVVDLTARICPGARCEVARGDLVLFRDGHHLTARYSATLAPVLGAGLDSAGGVAGGAGMGPSSRAW
jgi:peptidoglycan/LPS O-acetylase OafA/YrhL